MRGGGPAPHLGPTGGPGAAGGVEGRTGSPKVLSGPLPATLCLASPLGAPNPQPSPALLPRPHGQLLPLVSPSAGPAEKWSSPGLYLPLPTLLGSLPTLGVADGPLRCGDLPRRGKRGPAGWPVLHTRQPSPLGGIPVGIPGPCPGQVDKGPRGPPVPPALGQPAPSARSPGLGCHSTGPRNGLALRTPWHQGLFLLQRPTQPS